MSLNSKLAKHFALAAVATAAVATAANASVITTNYNIVIGATFDGLYLNVETGANNGGSTGGGGTVPGWDVNVWNTSNLSFFSPTDFSGAAYFRVAGGATATSNLGGGQLIDVANGTWQSSAATATGVGAYVLNARNYFGFRFKTAGGATNYGYMAIDIGAAITTRTLAFVSYEDSGAGITVVPAPGAIALLGLAGLAGRRRRA
jgi:MYXO-CTERM domain-containing protein